MSSRDLEGDYAVPPSRLGAASSTEGSLSRSLDSRTTQKSKVRLVRKTAYTQSIIQLILCRWGQQGPNRQANHTVNTQTNLTEAMLDLQSGSL